MVFMFAVRTASLHVQIKSLTSFWDIELRYGGLLLSCSLSKQYLVPATVIGGLSGESRRC